MKTTTNTADKLTAPGTFAVRIFHGNSYRTMAQTHVDTITAANFREAYEAAKAKHPTAAVIAVVPIREG